MVIIDNYYEIESKNIQVGEKFEIHKGKLSAIYKVIKSDNFEGCYELLKYVDYHYPGKYITGCGSVLGCVKLAYDIT